jgi:hypothetical protein
LANGPLNSSDSLGRPATPAVFERKRPPLRFEADEGNVFALLKRDRADGVGDDTEADFVTTDGGVFALLNLDTAGDDVDVKEAGVVFDEDGVTTFALLNLDNAEPLLDVVVVVLVVVGLDVAVTVVGLEVAVVIVVGLDDLDALLATGEPQPVQKRAFADNIFEQLAQRLPSR